MTRTLPHDLDAERTLLGALLLAGEITTNVRTTVSTSDFYSASHRIVYKAMLKLEADDKPLDPALLRRHLLDAERLDDAGGFAYLAELLDGVARSANVLHYARTVRDLALERERLQHAEAVRSAILDGESPERVRELAEGLLDACGAQGLPDAVSVYGDPVKADPPEWTVAGLLQRHGLHLIWAKPNAGKTYALLRWVHQLLVEPSGDTLCGHPELAIRRPYKRVLWIGTEETTGRLRWRGDKVMRGLGGVMRGELLHLWSADPKRRVTLDDMHALVERYKPDAVVVDPLTGLRPKQRAGVRIAWDMDNDAANELCMTLRGIASTYGVDMVLVHHSNKAGEEYRGPTEWWAAADVKVGLDDDKGRLRVTVEKLRDGRRPDPFYLEPSWTDGTYTLRYDGPARTTKRLTPTQERIVGYFQGQDGQRAAQVVVVEYLPDIPRSTALRNLDQLLELGRLRDTGERERNSRVLELVDTPEVPTSAHAENGHARTG